MVFIIVAFLCCSIYAKNTQIFKAKRRTLEIQVLEELYNETSAPPSLEAASKVEVALGDLAGDVVEPYSLTAGLWSSFQNT